MFTFMYSSTAYTADMETNGAQSVSLNDVSEVMQYSVNDESLEERLDNLIISYLELIDEYSKLQRDIAQNFSAGFLSLAQANYNASGRRFGQDFYDERMKAMKGIDIEYEDKALYPNFRLQSFPLGGENPEKIASNNVPQLRRRKLDEGGIAEKFEIDTVPDCTNEIRQSEEEEKDEAPHISKDPREPLRWFGILVPPALKEAQAKFCNALETLPILISLLRNLDWHESEIRRVRELLDERGPVEKIAC